MAKGNRGNGGLGTKIEGNRPTMTDIARIAGVSQSSVSLVLNEMSGSRISAETQMKVRQAAHKIGYRLPSVRRDPPPRAEVEKDTIAFIVDEISTSPHPVVSLDGARDYAFEQGFLVSAHATRSNPDLEDAVLRSVLRESDYLVRWGGEEFLVVLPATPRSGAVSVGEKLRLCIESLDIPHAGSSHGRITISIGGASTFPAPGESVQSLIQAADRELYVAKKEGRNRMRIQEQPESAGAHSAAAN